MAVDTSRGTVLWSFNQFKSEALARLMDDLVDAQEGGLTPEQCNEVKKALAKITNLATTVPDRPFLRRAVWQLLERFENTYEDWNDGQLATNGPDHRKKMLRKLRRHRHRIATRARHNFHVLERELDLKLMEDMYSALGDLSRAFPDVFRNLSVALKNFSKRRVPSGA